MPLRPISLRVLLCVVTSSTAFACSPASGGGGGNVCTPGKTELCPCAGGGFGTQSCNQAGTGYTAPCECGAAQPADAGATDGAEPDAGAPDTAQPEADPGAAPDTELCYPKFSKACEGDSAFWYDSCGNKGDLAEKCAAGTSCFGGKCQSSCQPKATKSCKNNNVFWFDSCGKENGVAVICNEEDFCKEGEAGKDPFCVKPFYNGTWLVTANPDSKPIPGGLGTAYFYPTLMELTIDGSKAHGYVEAFDPPISYDGTLTGKVLKMTAEYTQGSDVGSSVHKESLIVTFESPSKFVGTVTDSLSVDVGFGEPTPLGQLVWQIAGVKQ